LVDISLIALLAGHLICMNIASVGPLLCVLLLRPAIRTGFEDASRIAAQLALWSVGLLLLGIIVGVALGFLAWAAGERSLVQILPEFGRKITWGVLEIICSLGWMLGYWIWLKRRLPQSLVARYLHAGLAVLSATNLLYHFPPLLTVMTQAATGEIVVTQAVDAATFRKLALNPNVMAHTVHFWLACGAVSSVFLFWLVRKLERPEPYFALGGRIALGATLLQIPTGCWLLIVCPPALQSRLTGGHVIATSLFIASLVCVFLLLQNLATLVIGEADRKPARKATIYMAATVILMTGALHYLRA